MTQFNGGVSVLFSLLLPVDHSSARNTRTRAKPLGRSSLDEADQETCAILWQRAVQLEADFPLPVVS